MTSIKLTPTNLPGNLNPIQEAAVNFLLGGGPKLMPGNGGGTIGTPGNGNSGNGNNGNNGVGKGAPSPVGNVLQSATGAVENNSQSFMTASLNAKPELSASNMVLVKVLPPGTIISGNNSSLMNINHFQNTSTTNTNIHNTHNTNNTNTAFFQQNPGVVFVPPQQHQPQPPAFFPPPAVPQPPVPKPPIGFVPQPPVPQLPTPPVTQSPLPPVSMTSTITNPLAGSAAEVFARAGVISITEPTQATITFESEHAAFKNSLVMYKLDETGVIKSVQAIFPNASATGSGGHLQDGVSAVNIDLKGGDQVGFALLPDGFSNDLSKALLTRPDGRLEMHNWKGEPANLFQDPTGDIQLVHIDDFGNRLPINGEFGHRLFHSTGNVDNGLVTNWDGKDHADKLIDPSRGLILIGMDDLPRGDDAIRKNLIITMDVGQTNAMAMNQNLIDDRPRTFRELAGADMMASHAEIMTAARMFDKDGDGRLNEHEWAEFAPLLNLRPEDHKHFVGLRGRGDLDSLSLMINRGDVNGNAMLDEREVLELGRRLNGNNPNMIQSFREAAGIDWKLSYEEFISTAESHDKDNNGLDQQEWNRFAPVLGLTPQDRNLFLNHMGKFDIERFVTVFNLADTNGDGQLEPREVLELRRLVHEHFAPKDFPQGTMSIPPFPMSEGPAKEKDKG